MSVEMCQLCVKKPARKGINLCGNCEYTVLRMPLTLSREDYVSAPFQKTHRVSISRRSRRQSHRQCRKRGK
jgi:hypothetical protein